MSKSEITKSPSSPSSPTIVFLQTAAYRFPGTNNSTDLGSFDEFTEGTSQGYLEYAKLFPPNKGVVAPVGRAYQFLRNTTTSNERRDDNSRGDVILQDAESIPSSSSSFLLWEKLYARDDFHPSPHGTLLQANVLYCTIVGEQPPVYDSAWWTTARYMQPSNTEPLPLPTNEEANILRKTACIVCNISIES